MSNNENEVDNKEGEISRKEKIWCVVLLSVFLPLYVFIMNFAISRSIHNLTYESVLEDIFVLLLLIYMVVIVLGALGAFNNLKKINDESDE